MSFKNNWIPQNETMDASPDIPNMLADGIIQNETDIQRLKDDFEDLDIGGAGKSPYIGENGNWYEWDGKAETFVDTGVKAEGYTPQKGIDYWTDEDKAEIIEEVEPFIVTGSLMVKKDAFEYIPENMSATFAEIKEAYDEGKNVIVKVLTSNNYYLYAHLARIDDVQVRFYGYGYEYSVDYEEYSWVNFSINCDYAEEWYAYCEPLALKYDLIDHDERIQVLENEVSEIQSEQPVRVDIGITEPEHPDGARLINASKTYDEIWDVYNSGKEIEATIWLWAGADAVYNANVEYTPWGDENVIAISGYGETGSAYHEILYYPDGTLVYNTRELADKTYVDNKIGDIETALDSIIAIQNELLGVSE